MQDSKIHQDKLFTEFLTHLWLMNKNMEILLNSLNIHGCFNHSI